jgi:hypothetical protein
MTLRGGGEHDACAPAQIEGLGEPGFVTVACQKVPRPVNPTFHGRGPWPFFGVAPMGLERFQAFLAGAATVRRPPAS